MDMGRIPYWLIDWGVLIDFMGIPVALIFCFGIFRLWKTFKKAHPSLAISRKDIQNILNKVQITQMTKYGLLGLKVYLKPITGLFHGMVFWGMLLLFLGTFFVLLNVLFDTPLMTGAFYKWIMAFALDAGGLAVFIGVAFLLVRRLGHYHRLVVSEARSGMIFIELLLLVVVASGFIVEALRIDLAHAHETAFVGQFLADMIGPLQSSWPKAYSVFWWVHGLLALAFIAYLPFSPLVHLLLIPLNAALVETNIGAEEKTPDFSLLESAQTEDFPTFGTPTISDCHPKRLLDFTACLWCGRCQEVCPATCTDKSLTPKGVMVGLADNFNTGNVFDDGLIDAVGMETLFECRTCGACVDACPAMTNPLKTILGMRQNLVMERGEMPEQMMQALRDMQTFRHPFATKISPSQWREGLEVPQYHSRETEYLLWIGCATRYEARAQKVGRAMIEILNNAGVSYGIIDELRCTGDPAKQMGEDYLFSEIAKENITIFDKMSVKKIITICPHCFNSLNKYYPALGGIYDIVPHVDFIADLIGSGALSVKSNAQKLAYHDPCYYGRHNSIYTTPRTILKSLAPLIELKRSGNNSFCCGAGGGNYWADEKGERISHVRAQEACASGADGIACACPFCLLMLSDGMAMHSDQIAISDVAELVAQNMVVNVNR